MCIKLFAIGNRMMGDDGVAVAVAENLYEELTSADIQVVIGETDVEYCLDFIENADTIIIVDAAISGRPVGTVWKEALEDALSNCEKNRFQHDDDLLYKIRISSLKVIGIIICIEAADFNQRWGLSEVMKSRFTQVCSQVKDLILEFRGDNIYA